nr:TetR-like C-terminal domain-containing protein [Pseudoclavibacter chungangensis]
MFGGKTELIRTVVQKAAQSFGRTQAAALKGDDVVVDLFELGLAYRRWAIENRALYTVMFGSIDYENVADEHRDGVSSETPDGSQGPLIELLTRASEEGLLLPVPVPVIVASVWGNVHGLVSLEIAPWSGLPELAEAREEIYRLHQGAILRGWVRPDIDLSEYMSNIRTTTSAPAS